MFIQSKAFLRNLSRMRVSEGRNLTEGLRLDRNEKVDVWPEGFLAKIMASTPNYFLSVYPESGPLYTKLSRHLGVKEDQVLLTTGIDGGLKTLFEIMTSPGDQVGVLSPTYAMYKIYSNLFQTQLTEIGYKADLSLDRVALDKFISERPKILFLPNPNQPIESSLNLRELEELAEKTRKANCLFVVDEAYYMFGAETAMPLLDKYENVVVARTFSKGFGVPSIRLGYLVSNSDNMKVLSKTRFAHESNALSNAVAEYLLDNYPLVEDYIKQVIAGRTYTQKALTELGYRVHCNTGNYMLIDLKTPELATKYVAKLKERLIYVKGPWASPWNNYVTITLGPTELMGRFIRAMKEIKSEVEAN